MSSCRCSFSDCPVRREPESDYCKIHKCMYCSAIQKRYMVHYNHCFDYETDKANCAKCEEMGISITEPGGISIAEPGGKHS